MLRSSTNMYVALVYDISNRESFETIEWWFSERSHYAPKSAVKIIVGNKADNVRLLLGSPHFRYSQKDASQGHDRQIPTAEAAAYASRMGALFVEASAKTAVGLREVFRDTLERVLESPISSSNPTYMSVSSATPVRAT